MAYSLDVVRSTPASEIIGERIALRKSGAYHVGCCPFHADSTPSLHVFHDSNRFWCFGCEASGDAIDFVMRFDGCSFPEALERIGVGESTFAPRAPVPKVSKARGDNVEYARQLYAGAAPIIGSIGEQYLSNRAIELARLKHNPPLRFEYLTHPDTKQRHPTIISRVDDASNILAGIQRTFLTDDGFKLPKVNAKLSMGDIRGNATKLSPANDEIVLCEGLEDGLSLQTDLPTASVWVTAGTSNLSSVILPLSCKRVTIAADNDEAGCKAAEAAVEVYLRQGFDTRVIHPDHQFKDFNEQFQKANRA